MEAQMKRVPKRQKIQVYNNDFLSGIVRLARKLFML